MAAVRTNRFVVNSRQAPVVVVADLGKRPIGTGLGGYELEHALQALVRNRRHG